MRVIAFDTETYLLTDRIQAPKPVCCTWFDGQNASITRPDDPATYARWADPSNVFVGQSISYDIMVMMLWHPHFIPLMIQALDEGRVFDTSIREQLQHLATQGGQGYRPFIGLADLVQKYLGLDISIQKDDAGSWRLRFGIIDHTPIDQWPQEALNYALEDARLTWQVFQSQGGINSVWPTEQAQVRADVVLRAIGVWGFAIDRNKNTELAVRQQAKIDALQKAIGHHGWDGKGSKARLAADVSKLFNYKQKMAMLEAGIIFKWDEVPSTVDLREECERFQKLRQAPPWSGSYITKEMINRIPGFPKTPKGQLQVSEDAIKSLFDIAPDLEKFVQLHHEEKMMSTYIKPYQVDVSHGRYTTLVSTGRTACSPGHQTIPRSEGYREQFVPRSGYLFGTVDYSALELCTLAATFRHYYPHIRCTLGDMIDQDMDVHSFTGSLIAGLSYEEVKTNKKKEPYATYRQGAKACYSGDTELLTPAGWVEISKLCGKNVMVAQFDPKNDVINFVLPQKWHKYENCEFLHISTDAMDLCVTPDHRLLFKITLDGVGSFYASLRAGKFQPSEDQQQSQFCSINISDDGIHYNPLTRALVEKSASGDSFCVTVPTSWVLIRRNGKITVSGNSNFGFPGGLGIKAFQAYAENNYGVKFSYDEASHVREAWHKALPEIDDVYLRDHKALIPRHGDVADSTLINGRTKAKCIFTEMSNFKFQGLAADGAKRALFAIWREIVLSWYYKAFPQATGYGVEHRGNPLSDSHLPAFIHDEVVAEHPEGPQGEAAFKRQQDLMVSEMQAECKNLITIRVEGKLQHNWGH